MKKVLFEVQIIYAFVNVMHIFASINDNPHTFIKIEMMGLKTFLFL